MGEEARDPIQNTWAYVAAVRVGQLPPHDQARNLLASAEQFTSPSGSADTVETNQGNKFVFFKLNVLSKVSKPAVVEKDHYEISAAVI